MTAPDIPLYSSQCEGGSENGYSASFFSRE
jgi:hypothetical protein